MSAIILEGPDGGGKSTLATRIIARAHPGSRFVHHGAYLGEQAIVEHYEQPMLAARLASATRVARHPFDSIELLLMDRSWLAEPIYGAVMRDGTNRIDRSQRDMLDGLFQTLGGVVVLVLPPLDVCIENWRARRGTEYPREDRHIHGLWVAYRDAAAEWRAAGHRVIRYDYTIDAKSTHILNYLTDLGVLHD